MAQYDTIEAAPWSPAPGCYHPLGARGQQEGAVPTILIVDDEANIRDVVQYALAREGFSTKSAADGRQALALLEEGAIDLVILDILMPELDGLSVCRKIREGSALPIIFLSSRGRRSIGS
jgi:two-component system, OmpR family, response regulator